MLPSCLLAQSHPVVKQPYVVFPARGGQLRRAINTTDTRLVQARWREAYVHLLG
jgi:hypothetical protein